MLDPDEAVRLVFEALRAGRLGRGDLTARKLSSSLGATTMVLYHHFGSLEGFLIRVDGAGWKHLHDLLRSAEDRGAGLAGIASTYLDFAFGHPDLYWLMAERRFDREALRASGRLSLGPLLWGRFAALIERQGGDAVDAQLFFGTLHGLVALVANGRGNLGEGPDDARDLARGAARRLVERMGAAPRAERKIRRK